MRTRETLTWRRECRTSTIKEDNLPWVQVSSLKLENEAAELYGIKYIPSNVLVDPKGVIVAKNLRGSSLQSDLAKFLN